MSAAPDDAAWRALWRELDRWAEENRTAAFWWRDDDATRPGNLLDRLLALSSHLAIPVTLGVIPAAVADGLQTCVAQHARVTIGQHGWDHHNHATGRPAELGLHRPRQQIVEQLERGWQRLTALFQGRFSPVLVAPFNAIDARLLQDVQALGFRVVSSSGRRRVSVPVPGLLQLNIHVDVLDWMPEPRFRGADHTLRALCRHLEWARLQPGRPEEPTGILTHHADLDSAAFEFVERLLSRLSAHPAARWVDAADIAAHTDRYRPPAASRASSGPVRVLGLNRTSDASICLLEGDRVAFSVAKERLSREKYAWGRLGDLQRYYLQLFDEATREIDIAVECYGSDDELIHWQAYRAQLAEHLRFRGEVDVEVISHHLAHVYSSFFPSGFEEAAVMVVDYQGSPASFMTEPFPQHQPLYLNPSEVVSPIIAVPRASAASASSYGTVCTKSRAVWVCSTPC